MDNDKHTIDSLVAGGLIGATLGAWLSKDKEDGAIIGALLGAAFSATLFANQQAQKTNQAVLVAEDGKLYKFLPSGEKQFIKDLPKSTVVSTDTFKLR